MANPKQQLSTLKKQLTSDIKKLKPEQPGFTPDTVNQTVSYKGNNFLGQPGKGWAFQGSDALRSQISDLEKIVALPPPPKPPKVTVPKTPKPAKPPKVTVPKITAAQIKTQDLAKYPHMFPNDLAIWKRFIPKFGADYQRFDYDVKVGSGTQDIQLRNDIWSIMQQILSKYRIDVVGYRSGETHIIEVKPEATASAVGQVLVYKLLYERQIQPTNPVIQTIVTDYEMPDMRYLTKRFSINYIVI